MMNKEGVAKILNGREYGNEITNAEEKEFEKAGLVVVFGYSDDNVEFRGAINEEISCYDGGEFLLDKEGVLPNREQIDDDDELEKYFIRKKGKTTILECLWCKEKDYSWTYKIPIPHSTFDIMEDGKKFCRGIVFSLKDLK